MKNICYLLKMREIDPKTYQPLLREEFYTEFFKFLRQEPIDMNTAQLNKIFCSIWISEEMVIFGTKDKRLCWLNVKSKYIYLIKDYRTYEEKEDIDLIRNSSGIRSIDYSCNKLAVSVNNSVDIFNVIKDNGVIFLKKEKSIKVNMNWISNIKWMDYNKIIISSKDATIKLCNVDTNQYYKLYEYSNNSNTVENLNYCRHFSQEDTTIYSLSPDGIIKFFDMERQKKFYEKSNDLAESVVSKFNKRRNLFTIGSRHEVTFFDTRVKTQILQIPNMNDLLGTRTIEWYDDNVLSIGGGKNNLSFFDIRVNRGFIKFESTTKIYKIDRGWVRTGGIYDELLTHRFNPDISIYTHCYNAYKNKIFVAGGPTIMGNFGSHISILE